MELSWFYLLLMTASTASAASYCPFGNSSSCQCEDYEGGHDLWCPDRYNHDYRFKLQLGHHRGAPRGNILAPFGRP